MPDDDAPALDPLPEQEQRFRAPARFGNVPVAATPLGWDARNPGFRNHYPDVRLPTQIVERVPLGHPELEPNRLLWGDNLHVMRSIPSESVDLVYIDPPFFSNRVYNVIWGDEQEIRSFDDLWKEGLDGYLIWLNARLYELKRLLKPTGSIYVQCDWRASHYIKCEMDKIFGYDNFRNEIVWRRGSGISRTDADQFPRNQDSIIWYSKHDTWSYTRSFRPYSEATMKQYRFDDHDGRGVYRLNPLRTYGKETIEKFRREGRIVVSKHGNESYKQYLSDKPGVTIDSIWEDIGGMGHEARKEKVGYPTQKPEKLLERIIKASSNEGDLVLDAFVGGGTTPTVAQRLGRRWIAMDQSRVAVSVTAERLKHTATERGLQDAPVPDFYIEHWGVYEADKLAERPAEEFRAFVLDCYDARERSADAGIHGYKGSRARIPVWVGEPALTARVTADEVNEFARAIAALERYRNDEGLRDGDMLAWGFAPEAREAAKELRGREGLEIAFVRLEQVPIDSPAFRSHVASKSTKRGDYSGFLTFVQPPVVAIAHRRLRPLRYAFDASDTQVLNAGGKVVNVHWDFAYDGRVFRAARGEWFRRGKGKNPPPVLDAQHAFPQPGRYTVACRVQDDKGGEGMATIELEAE